MRLYDRFVLPRLVHFTCGLKPNMRQRAKVVPAAFGTVLEIGFGSGLNVTFYDEARVDHVFALEPSAEMCSLAQKSVNCRSFRLELIRARGEAVPLADGSLDIVVVTYTFCTVPDVLAVLRQIKRILKPGGALLFCEHGLAPDQATVSWQNRLNAIWKAFAGGCNLNRPIPLLLKQGGFEIAEMQTMYIPGWKPASFNYWGKAIPASDQHLAT